MTFDRQYILTHTPRQIVADALAEDPFNGYGVVSEMYQRYCYHYGGDIKLPQFDPRYSLDMIPLDREVEELRNESISAEGVKLAILADFAFRYMQEIDTLRANENPPTFSM